MKALNIVLAFPHFNTVKQASSLRSTQVALSLKKAGHEVTVFAPGVDQRSFKVLPELRGRLYAKTDFEGICLIRPRTLDDYHRNATRRLLFELIFSVLTFLRALFIRKIDVIAVSYPPLLMPIFMLLLARLRRVPFVLEVRDLVADALEESDYANSSWMTKIAHMLERYVVKHSDAIIVVSNGIQRILTSRGVDDSKFTFVPIGYAPEVFDDADMTFNAREEFDWQDKFVVIYTGALTPAYDIPTLLRAAKRLKSHNDIRIVIMGGGELKQKYVQYCQEHELYNCQFIEYQPRQMLPAILSQANAGVHLFRDNPVWAYVLGNKTFDYLASGLPMIYAGTGDTADLINESDGGIVVTPESDEELADAILHLAANPESAHSMGKQGQSTVKANYNAWTRLADYNHVLRNLVVR